MLNFSLNQSRTDALVSIRRVRGENDGQQLQVLLFICTNIHKRQQQQHGGSACVRLHCVMSELERGTVNSPVSLNWTGGRLDGRYLSVCCRTASFRCEEFMLSFSVLGVCRNIVLRHGGAARCVHP